MYIAKRAAVVQQKMETRDWTRLLPAFTAAGKAHWDGF